jgi:SAM-dependent methyltransferase
MSGQDKIHLFRYHLARGFVTRGDRVLDLGCGQGYGTNMLSLIAKEVTGVDIDKEQIDHNKEHGVWKMNQEFVHADLEKWDIPEAEVAVQFENLEHLYDPANFVKKLKKKIKKFIIVSVPFGCEKLVEKDGDIQADLDSTHHFVFDTPQDLDKLYLDDNWLQFFSFNLGVTYISIYFNKDATFPNKTVH